MVHQHKRNRWTENMFRIKASYADQMELRTSLEKAREFFGELRNFADLMPGIEGIRKEAGGIMRWMVRAEVPVIGPVVASFTVEKTEDSPERLGHRYGALHRLENRRLDVRQLGSPRQTVELSAQSRHRRLDRRRSADG